MPSLGKKPTKGPRQSFLPRCHKNEHVKSKPKNIGYGKENLKKYLQETLYFVPNSSFSTTDISHHEKKYTPPDLKILKRAKSPTRSVKTGTVAMRRNFIRVYVQQGMTSFRWKENKTQTQFRNMKPTKKAKPIPPVKTTENLSLSQITHVDIKPAYLYKRNIPRRPIAKLDSILPSPCQATPTRTRSPVRKKSVNSLVKTTKLTHKALDTKTAKILPIYEPPLEKPRKFENTVIDLTLAKMHQDCAVLNEDKTRLRDGEGSYEKGCIKKKTKRK